MDNVPVQHITSLADDTSDNTSLTGGVVSLADDVTDNNDKDVNDDGELADDVKDALGIKEKKKKPTIDSITDYIPENEVAELNNLSDI